MLKDKNEFAEEQDVAAEEMAKAKELLGRESSYRFGLYKQRKEVAIQLLEKVDALLDSSLHLRADYSQVMKETYNRAAINRANSLEDLNSWIELTEDFFQILWNESDPSSVDDALDSGKW